MRVIDLRSDTATLPSPGMRQAMATAEVGDDVLGEDPTVNRLESLAAEMLGKEAAIFLTSGTMGNLVGILAHCQRGDEIIVGDQSHIFRAEAGGASVLGGVAIHPIRTTDRGMLEPDDIRAAIHPDNYHYAPTRMVGLENTHAATGGQPLTMDDMKAVGKVAGEHGLAVHVDGARIFDAAVCLKIPVAELARDADTVTFCLSKGLGAPIGSLLCGSGAAIKEARRWRKMLGAGMRQVGFVAAAGIYALENMIERIAEDHANARKLARGLSSVPGITIDPDRYPTNMIFFKVSVRSTQDVVRRLEERGIKVGAREPAWRLVAHYGITSEDIDYTLEAFDAVFREYAV